MFIEVVCPCCGEKQFVDIAIGVLETKKFKGDESVRTYVIQNIKVKTVIAETLNANM